MISIFIWLSLIATLEAGTIRDQRAVGCLWKGHCAGDRCSTYNDCDGSLICQNGKCTDASSSRTCSPSGVLPGKK